MLVQFMAGVCCSANRFSQLNITRMDRSIQRMFGWDKMFVNKTFQRYFNKVELATAYNLTIRSGKIIDSLQVFVSFFISPIRNFVYHLFFD